MKGALICPGTYPRSCIPLADRRWPPVLCALAVWAFPTQGQAQGAPRSAPPSPTAANRAAGEAVEPLDIPTADSVVITVRPDHRDVFDQPAAVAVVAGEAMRRQAPGVLPDLLRDQPGVFVQQTSPGQGAPVLRGLIGSAVLMLVDGVRLNNAFFRPAPNQFFALVDAYNVERVEILRGPGSSPYGSDAMGGVVRVFSPTPRFSTPTWQVQARALGQVASVDRSVVSRVSLAGGRQGLAATAGFTFQRRGDLQGGGDVGVQSPSGFSAYAANTKLVLERGAHQATVGAQYLVEPETPRYDELVPGFGRTEAPADLFFYSPMSRLALHGHHRYTSGLAAARSVETRISFQRMQDGRRLRDRGARIEIGEDNRADTLALAVEAVAALETRNTLSYGVELSQDRVASARLDTDLETGVGTVGPARYADGATMASLGLYAQDQWALAPRLTLVPGARFSLFRLNIPAADRELGTRLQLADLTGGLGALLRVVPGLNLVANLGRGFRAPNVFDLSTLGNRPGNRFQTPNPDLAPETIVGFDTGLKVASTWLTGELFGFYSLYRNKIEAVPTGEVDPQGRLVVRSENVARVDLMGLETALRAPLGSRLELSGALNYTHGRERGPEGRVLPADRVPPLHLRAGLFWRAGRRIWTEGFVRAARRQDRLSDRDLSDPRIDPSGTPGFTTLNLRLGGEIGGGGNPTGLGGTLRWRLGLENLLDVRYREHGSGIYAPGFSASVALEGEV